MEKTLGGDRLGAGNKMKVDLHNYSRSTHDRGYVFRTTMSAGTLVPFIKEIALPGDTFDIDLNADCRTHPTIGPLFGSFKMQLDVFQAPMRLYNRQLHNNKIGIGMNMDQVKFPIIKLRAPSKVDAPIDDKGQLVGVDNDNYQVNPSSILAYLGIRGAGTNRMGTPTPPDPLFREFQAMYYLAYWEIYKNYYANKMEEIGAVIHTPVTEIAQNVSSINILNQPDFTAQLLNAAPANSYIELVEQTRIRVTNNGNPVNPEDVLIETDVETYQLSQIGEYLFTVATEEYYQYKAQQFGDIYARKWKYRTAADVPVGEIQVTTFPLRSRAILSSLSIPHFWPREYDGRCCATDLKKPLIFFSTEETLDEFPVIAS